VPARLRTPVPPSDVRWRGNEKKAEMNIMSVSADSLKDITERRGPRYRLSWGFHRTLQVLQNPLLFDGPRYYVQVVLGVSALARFIFSKGGYPEGISTLLVFEAPMSHDQLDLPFTLPTFPRACKVSSSSASCGLIFFSTI